MIEWQPIATAPKDGTPILLWYFVKGLEYASRPYVCNWGKGIYGLEGWWEYKPLNQQTESDYHGNYFSHWAPINSPTI